MKFEYTDIDLDTATPDQIKKEIERMKKSSNEWKNEEQAIKILINSFFGGMGNKWLVCFNPEVAESITHQGQSLIKHSYKVLDHYFQNIWPKDKELHDKLGITVANSTKKSMIIYSDTDSSYVCYDEVVEGCDWKGDPKELIIKINEYRLTEYLKGAFDRYAAKQNTVNYQDFELENVSQSGIWIAKKKYLLDIVWQDGIDMEATKNITYKGVEIVQSSTPTLSREKLKELIKYIFTKKKDLKLSDVISILRKYKEEFRMSDPEKIAMGRTVGDYKNYILNDTTSFEIGKQTPIHVRAAGYYNYMLNQNPKYKNKYEMIKSADKVKFYHVKTKNNLEQDVFAFLPGQFPVEFAPEFNYDLQFEKTIVDPLNRVTMAMGLPEISGGLYIAHSLF